MFYKINIVLFFIFLYFIFFHYFVINNLDNLFGARSSKIIKFIVYNKQYIKTEILNNNLERFNNFLIPINQQLNRFNSSVQNPMYCNNINCNFPVYKIGERYAALNDLPNLIDIFYNYLYNLNDQEKTILKQNIGFNLYQFVDGKLLYNNENFCNLKQGGFENKKVKRVLPIGERCDIRSDGCTLENDRYYIETNIPENSFCSNLKNIEVEGNILCKNNLDINFNGRLCLSIDKYIPIVLLNILQNNDDYIIEIQDYTPPNIIQFKNKLEANNSEREEQCPENSSEFNELCQCNSGFTCVGNNCNQNFFSLETCYNCACNISV